jgi:hypothetical protein
MLPGLDLASGKIGSIFCPDRDMAYIGIFGGPEQGGAWWSQWVTGELHQRPVKTVDGVPDTCECKPLVKIKSTTKYHQLGHQ